MNNSSFLKKLSLTTSLLLGAQLVLPSFGTAHAQTWQEQLQSLNKRAKHPNILFIIMDDVGIDQLKSFNAAAPQVTPVMQTLAQQGVSFNNAWMMPECSPSRACFFTGR